MNFSVVFLKTLKEAKLQISTSILFHTIITTWDVLKKLLFSLKKGIWLFWTLQKVAVQKVSFSGTSCKNYAGDSSLIILQNRHNFLSQQLDFRVSRCSAWESFSDDCTRYYNFRAILKKFKTLMTRFFRSSIEDYVTIM